MIEQQKKRTEAEYRRDYRKLMDSHDVVALAAEVRIYIENSREMPEADDALHSADGLLDRIETVGKAFPFFNLPRMREFLTEAIVQYELEKAPQWVLNYLDDIFILLGEQNWIEKLTFDEVLTIQALQNEAGWKPQLLAVNALYKLFKRLGRNTSNIINY